MMFKFHYTLALVCAFILNLSSLQSQSAFAQSPANQVFPVPINNTGTGHNPDSTPALSNSNRTDIAAKLPVDLGAVRRLQVAGTVLLATPQRVGEMDILAPLPDDVPGLGISISRASTPQNPGNPLSSVKGQLYQIYVPQGRPIVLAVGLATAYINNVPHTLRVAPLIIRNRLWLPIFSIAPLIGAATRLQPDGTLHLNPTVQSVEVVPGNDKVTLSIKTSAPLPEQGVVINTSDDPPRITFDLPNYSMGFDAANTTRDRIVSAGSGDVQSVRAVLHKKFPDTTRITVDLKRPLKGVVKQAQPPTDKTLFAANLMLTGKPVAPRVATPAALSPPPLQGSLSGLTIVLDAGHGGHDIGARGSRGVEKTHTLDIVRRLRTHLMARGATVLLTREGDYFVTLPNRAHFANTRRADIFFSVHINSYLATSSGTETYYYTPQSLALARAVHKELIKATGLKDRGVLKERFFVIRNTTMPSVLTETCFISNPGEESLLTRPQFRERVAQGMAQGIINYATYNLRGIAG